MILNLVEILSCLMIILPHVSTHQTTGINLLLSRKDDFCDEWVYKNVSVVLVSGPLWGTVQAVDNEQGASIKICNSANRERFLELYWEPFRAGVSSDKQYCSDYEPLPVAFDYSTQETSGVGDNTISMFLVTILLSFLL